MAELQPVGAVVRWDMYVGCASKGDTYHGEFYLVARLVAENGAWCESRDYLDFGSRREAEWETVLLGMEAATENAATELAIHVDSESVLRRLLTNRVHPGSKYNRLLEKIFKLAGGFPRVTADLIPEDQNPARSLAKDEIEKRDYVVFGTMTIEDRVCVRARSRNEAVNQIRVGSWPSLNKIMAAEGFGLSEIKIVDVVQVDRNEFEVHAQCQLETCVQIRTREAKDAEARAERQGQELNAIPETHGIRLHRGISFSNAYEQNEDDWSVMPTSSHVHIRCEIDEM